MKLPQFRLQFNRDKIEFGYSIAIIVLIPALLIFNTLLLLNKTKGNFDFELRRKANLANEVFGATASDLLNNGAGSAAKLQAAIDRLQRDASEVADVSVYVADGSKFKVLASSNSSTVGTAADNLQLQLVWSRNQAIAQEVEDQTAALRFWRVLTPITDSQGVQRGITSMSVSLASADALIASTSRLSLIVLGATVFLVLLLLINHFRFVEYAGLFAKQKELDQLKNDFISVATHELKAPMTVIKGYISLVLEGDSGTADAEAMKTLRVAFEHTERLNRLVTDLLDVSRLEQGRTHYDMKPVDVSETLGQLATDYVERGKAKGVSVEYRQLSTTALVLADADRVSEIFTNLVDNAVKYSEKGAVVISHELVAGNLLTRVQDHGLGMSQADQARLFQRFYRIKTAKTADIPGTGLGLWIIKQYAQKMGGDITVESVEGQGTTFIVRLALAASAAPKP